MNGHNNQKQEFNYLDLIRNHRPADRRISPQPTAPNRQYPQTGQANSRRLQNNLPGHATTGFDRFRAPAASQPGYRTPPLQPRSPTASPGKMSPMRQMASNPTVGRENQHAGLQDTPSFYIPPEEPASTNMATSRSGSPIRPSQPQAPYSFAREPTQNYGNQYHQRENYNIQREYSEPYPRGVSSMNQDRGLASPNRSSRSTNTNNTRLTPQNDPVPDLQVFDRFYIKQEAQKQTQQERIKQRFRDNFHREYEAETKLLELQKSYFGVSVLVLVGCLAVLLLVFAFDLSQPKPYCDDRYGDEECLPCPQNSICSNGKITSCTIFYQLVSGRCVHQNRDEKLTLKILESGLQLLREARGAAICENSDSEGSLGEGIIRQHVENLHGDKPGFYVNSLEAFLLLRSHSEVIYHSQGASYQSSTPSYTASCFLKVFWRQNWPIVGLIIIVLVGIIMLYIAVRTKLIARARAEEMYQYLEREVHTSTTRGLSERTMQRMLKSRFKVSSMEVNDYWPQVLSQARGKRVVDFLKREEAGLLQLWWVVCE